jgi:hypothetical protein
LRHVLILLHTHIHAGGAELCEVGHADNLPGKKKETLINLELDRVADPHLFSI